MSGDNEASVLLEVRDSGLCSVNGVELKKSMCVAQEFRKYTFIGTYRAGGTSGSTSNQTGVAFRAIDHVRLAMPPCEEDQARAFYSGILGLQEIPKPSELAAQGGAWFQDGSVAVHLGTDQDFRPATKAHPAFRCDDLELLRGRLTAHGVEVVADQPVLGMAHFYLADLFGQSAGVH